MFVPEIKTKKFVLLRDGMSASSLKTLLNSQTEFGFSNRKTQNNEAPDELPSSCRTQLRMTRGVVCDSDLVKEKP